MDEAFAHDNLDRRPIEAVAHLTGSVPLNFPWSFPGGRIVLSATITTPSIPVYT
jgi:hypothetical protein